MQQMSFQGSFNMVTQFCAKIKIFKSDNALELDLTEFLIERGTLH